MPTAPPAAPATAWPPQQQQQPAQAQAIPPGQWLDRTIQDALSLRASDLLILVDPLATRMECSIRIDGLMRPFRRVEGSDVRVVIGTFKAGSNLHSAGSFRPEETIHKVMVDGEERKARVTLFRTHDGGNAIQMRLPPAGPLRRLNELDFSDHNLALVMDMLKASNRMVLFAGPMGSGKTTTAHGALAEVADTTRTVWTIEDPVERTIPGLIQLEVDEENDAGFDALLPALVRSDYNTLFLGEIRDQATAAAGVRQAKAGRQVLTTIHANDNVTALLRLIELAEDSPLSVLDSVKGVVSQRLVAKLNPAWNGRNPYEKYLGRVPIHEVLYVTEDLIEAVMDQRPLGEIRQVAARHFKSTFMRDAHRLLAQRITDEQEIVRTLGVHPSELRDIAAAGAGTVPAGGPAPGPAAAGHQGGGSPAARPAAHPAPGQHPGAATQQQWRPAAPPSAPSAPGAGQRPGQPLPAPGPHAVPGVNPGAGSLAGWPPAGPGPVAPGQPAAGAPAPGAGPADPAHPGSTAGGHPGQPGSYAPADGGARPAP